MFPQMSSTLQLQCLIFSFAILHISATPVRRDMPDALKPRQSEATPNPLDYAPDFSADPFPPWPDVHNADGSNISTQNWRGTKLFGWKGCDVNDKNLITSTMQDFYTLAQQDAVNNIDWSAQAVAEIWGHGKGKKVLLDNIKPQIQQIFQAAQQIYDKNWWVPPYLYDPPWIDWRNLWIRVQCSPDGDDDNICGDKPQKNPNCPDGTPPIPGTPSGVEAYSNPLGKYSKITFCNLFFNGMTDLQSVINTAKKNNHKYQNQLWNYQNRARLLFHEMTHLNYFMNAPDKSPYVEEAKIQWGSGKGKKNQLAYGPENIKILANYEAVGKGGFYTQRNADSYAWFAVAKYIESQVGLYPTLPEQKQVPVRAPTRQSGKAFATTSDAPLDNSGDWNTAQDPGHYIPGCSDFKSTDSATFGASTVNNSVTSCPDTNALSGVPYNVFSGGDLNPNIFDNFCEDIDGTVNSSAVFDSSGNPVTGPSRMRKYKRTPPPNASTYNTFNFKLSWTNDGAENDGCGQTIESCRDAFAELANSPCGHQGGEQETLTVAGSINLPGCGTYSYLISGPDVPGSGVSSATTADQTTATPTTSTSSAPPVNTTSADCIACENDLGASNCAASDSTCLVNQCENDTHCQACGIDCNQYAST